jgi:probable rRNA maturation factor
MNIEVNVSREGVEDDEPPSSGWIQRVVEETLRTEDFKHDCEVSVLLTRDHKMRELNRDYRGQDKSTDVLSFAFEEDQTVRLPPGQPRVLGDVVLSLETLERQARKNSVSRPKETAWALCHGVLHLLGYDHQTDEQESQMRDLEGKVLGALETGFFSW